MANGVTAKSKERMPSYFMESLSKLNLNDRFLFDETMEDKESYQAAVNILLENEIELLEKPVLSGADGCIPVRTWECRF